ncbi:helix-turn-helix domain-containing protein [Paenibacillus dendritiformis]|uniref:helix-turn-helix domain-containing protein n=1 Tax=Paenibacillus dendritiformis TaxID=130049 RepID=UPI001B3000A2|nr:helix-turn-helix transcriptional regulator [Paenibacillus dendritiformis]
MPKEGEAVSTVAAKPQRLGELIQYYRQKKELSLSKLQEAVGIDKGSLSRIENSEVKRPDFQSILSIAAVLDIPHDAIVEQYIEIGHKSEVIYAILQNELTTLEYPSLIPKIAAKFLEAPNEDSLDAVEKLYRTINSVNHPSTQLSLYTLIVDYSRAHGIMPYIAKGLYQKYMIERNDFSRLKETYQVGKNVLDYANFLSDKERILLYYGLSVHAYSLMYYHDAIEFGNYVVENGTGEPLANATHNVCNAYYHLGNYDDCNTYLEKYSHFPYPFVKENVELMTAFLNGKKGNIEFAITQFNKCLNTLSSYNMIHAITELMELYLHRNDLIAADQLLMYEEQILESITQPQTTPYKRSRLAYYFRIKGQLLTRKKHEKDAIDSFLKSTMEYVKIGRFTEAFESLSFVTQLMIHNQSIINSEMIKKVDNILQIIAAK